MGPSVRIGAGVPRLAPWTAVALATAAMAGGLAVHQPHHAAMGPAPKASVKAVKVVRPADPTTQLRAIEIALRANRSNPAELARLLDKLLALSPNLPASLQMQVRALADSLVKQIVAAAVRASLPPVTKVEPSAAPTPTPSPTPTPQPPAATDSPEPQPTVPPAPSPSF